MGSQKGKIRINVNDIIGKRLGKLKVIGYAGHYYDETKGGIKMRHRYVCACDCGTIKTIRRSQLKFDLTHSCGCARKERKRK